MVLGVDISAGGIKFLELSKKGARFRIESFAQEALPTGTVVDHEIKDIPALGSAIQRGVVRSATRLKNAAIALASSKVITKVIQMPDFLDEHQMETQIELEADRYVPYPRDEVNLDFQIMGTSREKTGKIDVLLAAARSENIQSRVSALSLANLATQVVDVEAYAIETAFNYLADHSQDESLNGPVAIVDIGREVTQLIILDNRKLIYTRELAFGGKQLTDKIKARYSLSDTQASTAHRGTGLPESYFDEVLAPFRQYIAGQIAKALQVYQVSTEHRRVGRILLAGGCATITGLNVVVERDLGLRTTIANPFANMEVAAGLNADHIAQEAPSFMVACGLALRSFD